MSSTRSGFSRLPEVGARHSERIQEGNGGGVASHHRHLSIHSVRPSVRRRRHVQHAYKGKRIVAVISCPALSLSPSPSLTLYDAECGNAGDDRAERRGEESCLLYPALRPLLTDRQPKQRHRRQTTSSKFVTRFRSRSFHSCSAATAAFMRWMEEERRE